MAYGLSGTLSALGGILFTGYSGQADSRLGTSYELIAITAAVVGGCSLAGGVGSIRGTVLGLLLTQIVLKGTGTITKGVDSTQIEGLVLGTVVLVAVAFNQRFQGTSRLRRCGRPCIQRTNSVDSRTRGDCRANVTPDSGMPEISRPFRRQAVRRMLFGLSAILVVAIYGVAGYLAMGWSFLDAIYQVVITISGVGFGEVRPLTSTAARDPYDDRDLSGVVLGRVHAGVVRAVPHRE